MRKIDSINKGLEKLGFKIDGERYSFVQVSYHTMVINGQPIKQTQEHVLNMLYIGDGCEVDENHNDIEGTELCGFDIRDEEDHSLTTIFVATLDDFMSFIGL